MIVIKDLRGWPQLFLIYYKRLQHHASSEERLTRPGQYNVPPIRKAPVNKTYSVALQRLRRFHIASETPLSITSMNFLKSLLTSLSTGTDPMRSAACIHFIR